MTPYGFRPADMGDLTCPRRWLRTSEVARWWGDPDEQLALLREDLGESKMAMLVISMNARPFAYAQHYDVHAGPSSIWRTCLRAPAPSTPSSANPT